MLSPQKAADKAKVSRKTIMNAINAKTLNARRNNRNRYEIDEDDLKAWSDSRENVVLSDTPTATFNESIRLEEQLVAAKNTIVERDNTIAEIKADKDTAIADLKTERDDWKSQAQRSMWQRLFSK